MTAPQSWRGARAGRARSPANDNARWWLAIVLDLASAAALIAGGVLVMVVASGVAP